MSDEQAQAMQQPGVRHESGDLPKSQGKRQSLSVLGTSDNPALIPATRSHGSPASRLKNTPHSHGNASGGNRVAASSHFHVAHPSGLGCATGVCDMKVETCRNPKESGRV